MTTHLWVLSVALAVTAAVNWRSVLRGEEIVERITKPLVVVLLMGVAWSLSLEGRVPGAPDLLPVLVALGLCLVGDVALLDSTETRFLVGLAAFLLAHVAYIWAILDMAPAEGFPWLLLVAVPAVVLLHAEVGRDIVRHSGGQKVPVLVYQLVLSALLLVAAFRGDWLLFVGCAVFVASDAVLGHDRFVQARRWAPLTVIITYHLAQALIVVALLR
ncbi:MAG: lysoplasmalogenase [Dermatophilaceae bacterium]|nr:lysoplasmalogenase [Dermatophilaceae bacterium]NUQ32779.1 lysoplasmalogenase [Dermatophilaceae bacterium]NUR14729.1 lysoplasmalogenase [Dermatophilaceae bacterium]NUR79032.1 lysoplasmalogenase [Dermatophilaceae bacterium]